MKFKPNEFNFFYSLPYLQLSILVLNHFWNTICVFAELKDSKVLPSTFYAEALFDAKTHSNHHSPDFPQIIACGANEVYEGARLGCIDGEC